MAVGGETFPTEGHLLIAWAVPETSLDIGDLRRQFPNLKITYKQVTPHFNRDAETIARFSEEEISEDTWLSITHLCTMAYLPPPRLIPQLTQSLKFIQLTSSGVNHLSAHPVFTSTTIPIANSSGISAPPIAEWVALQILADGHQQRSMYELQAERKWGRIIGNVKELAFRDGVGRRIGILGYGSIGRQSARILSSLGMEIVAFTARPRTTPASRRDTGYIVPGTLGDRDGTLPISWYSGLDKKSLHTFLSADLDYIVLALPLTPATTHILGAEEFALLGRRNAFVLNIGRGESFDQDALIAALKKPQAKGGLRGAALDVTTPEPLPENSELWGLKNVTITPHVSAWNSKYLNRALGVLAENVGRERRGDELVNIVDRVRGY